METTFKDVLYDMMGKEWSFGRYYGYLEKQALLADDVAKQRYTDKLNSIGKRDKLIPEDIAFVTGVNRTTVLRWLGNSQEKPTQPPCDKVKILAQVFDVRSDYLLGLEGSPDVVAQADYDNCKHLGLSQEAYNNVVDWLSENKATEYKAIQFYSGLNRLLEQKDLTLLLELGHYLAMSKPDREYTFDEDDVENLMDSMLSLGVNTKADLAMCVHGFLQNSLCVDMSVLATSALDRVKQEIVALKEANWPGFFDRTPAELSDWSDFGELVKQLKNSEDE